MKFEGKIVFTITDQSKIDPYSDFELWETLTVTFERQKRSPLGAAHAVGQIYEVPPPGVGCKGCRGWLGNYTYFILIMFYKVV